MSFELLDSPENDLSRPTEPGDLPIECHYFKEVYSDDDSKLDSYRDPSEGSFPFSTRPTTRTARIPRDVLGHTGRLDDGIPPTFLSEPDVIYDASMGFDRYSTYAPIIVNPELRCTSEKSYSFHANLLGSQLNIPGWLHELDQENDYNLREYLSFGIQQEFLIVDQDSVIPSYEGRNYSSVLKGEAHDFIDSLIRDELSRGKYVISDKKPHCIHGLGAVRKKSGGWRPITDCKRPVGSSINSFMQSTFKEFCYTTVDAVINMVQPGYYMASIDIAAAYRSILVHPTQWDFQGVSWNIEGQQRYLVDTHICFGLRCAPYLFTQVSNFVLRCLKRRGFLNCLVYLDDFLVMGNSRQECESAQLTLLSILRSLGLDVAWKKCVSPRQIITYLGVTFNSIDMTVSLPPEKIRVMQEEIKFFIGRSRASKKQIQRLCGILCHCAKVVKGGRTFSQRIIRLLKGWPESRKRVRLSREFFHDLYWWRDFASTFNGKNHMVKFNYGQGPTFYTDACLSGYGFWAHNDWQAGYYNISISPDTSSLDQSHSHWMNVHVHDSDSLQNINVLELIPVWLCVRRKAHLWENLHVLCMSDNLNVQYMINKGCSANQDCMTLLRDIFWWCAYHNVHLTCSHIAGVENTLADVLSRIYFTNSISVINDYDLCCSNPTSHSSGYG